MSAYPRDRRCVLDYRDRVTGAEVVHPEGWTPANEFEIPTARSLARNGIDVVLRNRVDEIAGDLSTSGIKSPDALLNVSGLWQPFDFKAINDATDNIKTASQRMARSAKDQGGSIVIYLARDLTSNEGVRRINSGILAAIFHDPNRKLRTIILLRPDGKMQIRQSEDFYERRTGFDEF